MATAAEVRTGAPGVRDVPGTLPEPRLGMHISISGGMNQMADRARDFGCEAAQIFSRSPRGGKARPLAAEEVDAARQTLDAAGVKPLVVHMPYFANLCAPDGGLRAYAVETMVGEFERATLLGSPYVVTHLGRTAEETGLAEALDLAAASVAEALGRAPASAGGVSLLLENTAGAGREIGADLRELAALYHRLEATCGGRVGICLDTCHAHAAGYDLGTAQGVGELARLALELFGPVAVKVIHANDAAAEAGSHKDRHAFVGQGTIGEAGFRALMAEPLFGRCPFLLETPGTDEERAEDLARLRRIRAGESL